MPVVVRKGVTVRKYFYSGVLVATALLAAALAVASAAAAPAHVLTTGKVGGPAVKTGAILKAGLTKRTNAVFATTLGKLTCTKSTFTAKVVTNPVKGAKPATATESITAETFTGCTISVKGVTIKSSSVGNLPYNGTVSDAKGNPVKISGRTKAKPLLLSITVKFGASTFSCSVKAASISGSWTNKGNATVFVKQKFTKASGNSLCPTSGTFTASYGPVQDTSVKGNPAVFVN
jgi:hypothetical protein